jgi:protease-4
MTPQPPAAPDWERSVLEKVALQAIQEQRRSRQWSALFKLLWFLFAFLVLAAMLGWVGRPDKDAAAMSVGRHTALVELEGVIAPESKASAEHVIKGLNRAFKDANTAGVVLRINSPGGSPVQAGYMNDEIRRLRAKYPTSRCTWWCRTCAPRAATTSPSRPTGSTSTRRASWAPSA